MDRSAFKAFYNETIQPLRAYVVRVCGDQSLADDIVQESYLKFLQKPGVSTEFPQMKAYLYSIATRLNLDLWKRAKVREKWQGKSRYQSGLVEENWDDRVALQADLAKVFDKLKVRERALLWLAYVEEQPHSEIARIVGLKERSVRVTLFRARRKLARMLTRHGVMKELVS